MSLSDVSYDNAFSDYTNGKITMERLAERTHINFYTLQSAFLHFNLDYFKRTHQEYYEWGNESCPHQGKQVVVLNNNNTYGQITFQRKRECPICWEELREE